MMTIIFGGNGKGKTSLMTHFLNESAFDDERILTAQNEVKKLNKEYGINMPCPKHFTYANGTYNFSKFGYNVRKNIDLFPERLGIQSEAPENVKCQFILPYATLGIDEAQTWFPSRDGDVKQYQFSFFEKHRHNNLNIYFATTRAKLIDIRIRELSYGIYIKERIITSQPFGGKRITWITDYIEPSDWEGYLNAPSIDKHLYSVEKTYTTEDDVFRIYDPESCKKLFYEGYNQSDLVIG